MEPVKNKNLKNLLEAVKKTFLPPTVRRQSKSQCWGEILSFFICHMQFPFPSTRTRIQNELPGSRPTKGRGWTLFVLIFLLNSNALEIERKQDNWKRRALRNYLNNN